MKITVLAGGLSPERDVSLTSGALIANALRRRGHLTALVDLYIGGAAEFTYEMSDVPKIGASHPDIAALIKSCGGRETEVGEGIIEACTQSDVTFLALHGGAGENGKVQALLDCFGVKYTGSGHLSSAMAMDKNVTKCMLCNVGVPTAGWITAGCRDDIAAVSERAAAKVGFPCVVKPLDGGSSVGVAFADDEGALGDILRGAFEGCREVIIEKRVTGREFSCGVLCGRALPPIEIIPKVGFYDYKNKYNAGSTDEICPAHLTEAQTERIMTLAKAAHDSLKLGSYSRADFILDDTSGDFVCLEVNNLPGMTPTSLLPQEAAAAGIGYDELCERLAFDALSK